MVIQGESSQCPEGLAAVAATEAVRSGGKLVLVGDPRQLPPVVQSSIAKNNGHDMSMHKRLEQQFAEDPEACRRLLLGFRARRNLLYAHNTLYYRGIP